MGSDRDLRIRILLDAMDKASGPLKKIRAASRDAAKDISSTEQALAKLEKAQGQIEGFRILKKRLADTSTAMASASSKVAELKKRMAEVDKPTKAMTAEFNRAIRAARELKEKHSAEAQQLQTLRDRLREAGVSTRNIVEAERQLRTQIAMTNDQLTQRKKRLEEIKRAAPRQLQEAEAGRRVDEQLDARRAARRERVNQAGGLVATALWAAGTATGVEAAKESAALESRLTDIRQKTGMARAASAGLRDEILRTSDLLRQAPDLTAEGIDNLVGKGLTLRQSLAAIVPISRTVIAYGADVTDISDAAYAAIYNLKVPVGELHKTLGIFSYAGKEGQFELKAMASYMPDLTAKVRTLGWTGQKAASDLASSLQFVRNSTGDDSTAANNLSNLLAKMTSKDVVENFKKLGVDVPAALRRAVNEGRSPIEEFIRLTDRALNHDWTKLSYVIGDQQAADAARAINAELKSYIDLRSRADALGSKNSTKDIIAEDAADRGSDTNAKLGRLKAAWSNMLAIEGSSAVSLFNPIMDWMSGRLEQGNQRQLHRQKVANINAQLLGSVARRPASFQNAYNDALNNSKLMAGAKTVEGMRGRAFQEAIRQRNAVESAKTVQQFQKSGRDITAGLAAGINAGEPQVLARTSLLFQRMDARLRKDAKIKSPSRKFAEIGGYMTAGLAIGIHRGGGEPVERVRQLGAKLASAAGALPAAVPISASASTSPRATAAPAPAGPITIQIYQQPGEDAQQLAKRVAAELDRQRGAAARSSYED